MAVVALALGLAGCSSDSSDDAAETPVAVTTDDGSETTVPAPDESTADPTTDTTADPGTDTGMEAEESGDSAGAAECGGVSADAIGAAVGAGDFDSADDISIDADTACLFSNSRGLYGVSVTEEPTSTFLAGDLDGVPIEEALSTLETLFTTAIDAVTVSRVDVGGNQAVLVTGTLITGGAAGKIGTVVDGVVVTVEADGSELAADPAGFEPVVTNVLALVTSSG